MKKYVYRIGCFFFAVINWKAANCQVKSIILNRYSDKNLFYHVGTHTPLSRFDYQQIAQKFKISLTGLVLDKITLNRFISKVNDTRIKDFDRTTFKINIHNRDPFTSGPGKLLNTEEIVIADAHSQQITVNLKSRKIKLPDTVFFVAIVFLKSSENERLVKGYPDGSIPFLPPVQEFKFWPVYQPFINMAAEKGPVLNVWAMDSSGKWSLYNYFSPDLTDLAISAELSSSSN